MQKILVDEYGLPPFQHIVRPVDPHFQYSGNDKSKLQLLMPMKVLEATAIRNNALPRDHINTYGKGVITIPVRFMQFLSIRILHI